MEIYDTYRGVGPAYVSEILKLNIVPEREGKAEAWGEKAIACRS